MTGLSLLANSISTFNSSFLSPSNLWDHTTFNLGTINLVDPNRRSKTEKNVTLDELIKYNQIGSKNPISDARLVGDDIRLYNFGNVITVKGFFNKDFSNLDIGGIKVHDLNFYQCKFNHTRMPYEIGSIYIGAAALEIDGKLVLSNQSSIIGSDWSNSYCGLLTLGQHTNEYGGAIEISSRYTQKHRNDDRDLHIDYLLRLFGHFVGIGYVDARNSNFNNTKFNFIDSGGVNYTGSTFDNCKLPANLGSYIRASTGFGYNVSTLYKINPSGEDYFYSTFNIPELEFLDPYSDFQPVLSKNQLNPFFDEVASTSLFDGWDPKEYIKELSKQDPHIVKVVVRSNFSGTDVFDVNVLSMTADERFRIENLIISEFHQMLNKSHGGIVVGSNYTGQYNSMVNLLVEDYEDTDAYVTRIGYDAFNSNKTVMRFTESSLSNFKTRVHEIGHYLGWIHSMGYTMNDLWGASALATSMSYSDHVFLGQIYEDQKHAEKLTVKSTGIFDQMHSRAFSEFLGKPCQDCSVMDSGFEVFDPNHRLIAIAKYEPNGFKDILIADINPDLYEVRFANASKVFGICLKSLQFEDCQGQNHYSRLVGMVVRDRATKEIIKAILFAGGRDLKFSFDGQYQEIKLENDLMIRIERDGSLTHIPYPNALEGSSQRGASSSSSRSSSSSSSSQSSQSSSSSSGSSLPSRQSSSYSSSSSQILSPSSGPSSSGSSQPSLSLSSSMLGASSFSASSYGSSREPDNKSNPNQGNNDVLLKALLPSLLVPVVLLISYVALKKYNLLPKSLVGNPNAKKADKESGSYELSNFTMNQL